MYSVDPIREGLERCASSTLGICPRRPADRPALRPRTARGQRFCGFPYRAVEGSAPRPCGRRASVHRPARWAIHPGDHIIAVGRGVRIDCASTALPLLYHPRPVPALPIRRVEAGPPGKTIVRLWAERSSKPGARQVDAMGEARPRRPGRCTMATETSHSIGPRPTWTPSRSATDISRSIRWYSRYFTHLKLGAAGQGRQERLARRLHPGRLSPFVLVLGQFFEGHDPFAPAPHLPMEPFSASASSCRPRRRWTRSPRAASPKAASASVDPALRSRSTRLLHQGSGQQHDRVLLRPERPEGAQGLGQGHLAEG